MGLGKSNQNHTRPGSRVETEVDQEVWGGPETSCSGTEEEAGTTGNTERHIDTTQHI